MLGHQDKQDERIALAKAARQAEHQARMARSAALKAAIAAANMPPPPRPEDLARMPVTGSVLIFWGRTRDAGNTPAPHPALVTAVHPGTGPPPSVDVAVLQADKESPQATWRRVAAVSFAPVPFFGCWSWPAAEHEAWDPTGTTEDPA